MKIQRLQLAFPPLMLRVSQRRRASCCRLLIPYLCRRGSTVLSPAANTNGAGRALWRVNDLNTTLATSYNETISSFVRQEQNGTAGPGLVQATTVRGVKAGPTAADFAAAQKNITGATNATRSWLLPSRMDTRTAIKSLLVA
jgi:hypothetical protein